MDRRHAGNTQKNNGTCRHDMNDIRMKKMYKEMIIHNTFNNVL